MIFLSRWSHECNDTPCFRCIDGETVAAYSGRFRDWQTKPRTAELTARNRLAAICPP